MMPFPRRCVSGALRSGAHRAAWHSGTCSSRAARDITGANDGGAAHRHHYRVTAPSAATDIKRAAYRRILRHALVRRGKNKRHRGIVAADASGARMAGIFNAMLSISAAWPSTRKAARLVSALLVSAPARAAWTYQWQKHTYARLARGRGTAAMVALSSALTVRRIIAARP